MPEHNPLRFATALSAKLAARSRHVCVFLGAGVGCACGLPDVHGLQKLVLSALNPHDAEMLKLQLEKRNLEQALSRLRRIAGLLTVGELIDKLSSVQATALDTAVCQAIVKQLEITSKTDLSSVSFFASWARGARYHLPLEIFTVNYDLLLETALEKCRVPYFDGFVGTLRARFHTELVEGTVGKDEEHVPAFFVRLWKLHGSVNWVWENQKTIVRLGRSVETGMAAAIYPSDAKYDESRRVPFVVLQDRFRRAMEEPESLVIIAGYSFSDDHLNELIFGAAERRQRSEFVALCYSEIPEILANRAVNTPNLQVAGAKEAVLGGVRGAWKAPDNAQPGLWDKGQFVLGDFQNLAAYLARSTGAELAGGESPSASGTRDNGR